MSRKPSRSVNVPVTYYLIASERIARLDCRDCGASLDIHQPNPNQPDQFLGTCDDCGSWFRIEGSAEGRRALVIRLPESREIIPLDPIATEKT